MTDLPPGWAVTTLGEIADSSLGKMLDRAKQPKGNLRPYLRNVNVQWGRIDLHDVLNMDIPTDQEDRYRLEAGDLLVCEGGEVGRCAVWQGTDDYMAFQKALHRIRPLGGIDSLFLRYWLEHLSTRGILARHSTGSTIKHLPQEQLRQLPLPLPPLAEQRRIVAALEDHLSRLGLGTSAIATSSARLDLLTRALTERLLSPTLAHTQKLSSLATEKMANGRSVPTKSGGFPVLRLTALRGGRIDVTERKSGAWTYAEAEPFLVKRGDFLVSRGNGSIHLVGRGGLVDTEPDPVAFPDTLIRIHVDPGRLNPEYLTFVWNSPYVRGQIEKAARTTAGIYKINQVILGNISLPVPHLDEQVRIVAQWRAATDVANRLSFTLADSMNRGRQLRASLLVEAFAGRLVGQDPNDEPASELLARIRAERAAAIPKQRTRVSRTRKELPAPSTRVTGDNYQQGELPL